MALKPAQIAVPRPETAAEAIALLDRQFPWLIGAERSCRTAPGGVSEAGAVL